MNRLNAILSFAFAGLAAISNAQTNDILLENLLRDTRPIAEIVSYNYIMDRVYVIPDAELPYIKDIHQFLVRNKSGLYLLVDGTGRLYKILQRNRRVDFVRIDSTRFFGYNFGFNPFSYNDSIYSFVG